METQALGIDNRGRVVGEYVDAAGTFHGFLWQRGRLTTIDGPRSDGAAVLKSRPVRSGLRGRGGRRAGHRSLQLRVCL
ncbi:MAG: hypothetical protein ABWZ63_05730, partial [Thermoleophilaceae bacterium]